MRTIMLKDLIVKNDIFDFDYNYTDKEKFEERFIEHYFFKNIGFETVEMFNFYLRKEVVRKAPYYERLKKVVNGLIIDIERGHKTITDFKGDTNTKDITIGETTKQLNNTINTIMENIDDVISSSDIVDKTLSKSLRENKRKLENLQEQLNKTTPYKIDTTIGVDNVVDVKTNEDTDDTENTNTDIDTTSNVEGKTNTKGKQDSETTQEQKDTSVSEEKRDIEVLNNYIQTVERIEIPLFEALENVKKVKTDIDFEFILSLNDLFSLIYY